MGSSQALILTPCILQSMRNKYFGSDLGCSSLISLIAYKKRNYLIFQLRNEPDKNLIALIEHGEDENLEFKSSFRYDYRKQKPNKALESVITKTIAGFMNTRGRC
jgi:hypothetical protein